MKPLIALPLAALTVLALSGCLLERVGPRDRTVKPYGAHWFKPGMTRESRRVDLAACGSTRGSEHISIPLDKIAAEVRPGEPNSANAYVRLQNQVGACMQQRGYEPIGDLRFLGGCDERCMYP